MNHEDIKRAGGPAFPTHDRTQHLGITLRDYFAGQAIINVGKIYDPDESAALAYEIADAMIRAREKV